MKIRLILVLVVLSVLGAFSATSAVDDSQLTTSETCCCEGETDGCTGDCDSCPECSCYACDECCCEGEAEGCTGDCDDCDAELSDNGDCRGTSHHGYHCDGCH